MLMTCRTALDGFESIFDLEDVSVGTEDWIDSEYLDVWMADGLASSHTGQSSIVTAGHGCLCGRSEAVYKRSKVMSE